MKYKNAIKDAASSADSLFNDKLPLLKGQYRLLESMAQTLLCAEHQTNRHPKW